ncbi:MAG: TIGR04086 family membrane protein [Gemmiger sp.]
MNKQKRVRPGGSGAAPRLPWVLLGSLAAGMTTGLLMLCLFAAMLVRFPVPLTLVKPFACVAAAAGAMVSGLLLANGLGRQKLLCGLGYGLFYSVCLAAAAVLRGYSVDLTGAGATVLLALVLGGLMGGAAAALRTG